MYTKLGLIPEERVADKRAECC